MTQRRRFAASFFAFAVVAAGTPALVLAQAPPAPAAAAAGGDLEVTVTYKGKGGVSAKNEISIFLFTDPNITAESMPVGVAAVETNGGAATFKGLPPLVYIAVVYDEKGDYEREGPPAPGTPIAIHGLANGTPPTGVKPGTGAKVAVTFDDSQRM